MPDEIRCLTVRQPWAWAIIHGGKDVENRSRNIAGAYRGLVAIHAGLKDDMDAWFMQSPVSIEAWYHPAIEIPRGAIIGFVDLVDSHRATPYGRPTHYCSPWAINDKWHLVLANPRPITPIPAKGRLGLWRPDADLAAAIAEAVAATG